MGSTREKLVADKVRIPPPTVSVIVPAYNVSEFIRETLDSVIGQYFQDFEVIVINDGSSDTKAFEERIRPYMSSIIYLKQPNAGVAAARNAGIVHARGTYLAFLDGDDIWFPDYLVSQIHFLRSTGCDFIYADAELFGDNVKDDNFMRNAPSHGEVSVESLINGTCNVLTSGTVALRERVLEVGGFDEDLPRVGMEDFDLWIRLLKSGASACYQKKILLKYRVRQNSLSGSNIARAERIITALNTVSQKYELTREEQVALESRLKYGRTNLALEKAKASLVSKDFVACRSFMDAALERESSLKYRGIRMLLLISPEICRHLFKLLRPDEYEVILKGIESREVAGASQHRPTRSRVGDRS